MLNEIVILDCSQKNVPFYEKCGFIHKEYEMACYFPENDVVQQATVSDEMTSTTSKL
jgi:hypothetical protein